MVGDADWAARVVAIQRGFSTALDASVGDNVPACEVMAAVVMQAVVICKQLGIGEDDFFDLVVKMYEGTSVVPRGESH